MKNTIRKYALQNAIHFKGKANPGAVLGKVLQNDPTLKKDIKELSKDIITVIREVNALSIDAQKKELKDIFPELLIKKKNEKKSGLTPLTNTDKGVILRFAPSPSGPMHIGHAYILSLNSEYCRMYNGRLILRIEDTNPSNIYEPAYKKLVDDAQWITKDNVDQVIIQSDRLGLYYDAVEKLISMEKAYVCVCDPDIFKELITQKKACPCRKNNLIINQQKYHRMFHGFKPGDAVIRMKSDIKHKNPAMRDFPLMRINDDSHPRMGKKHRVWPLMVLSVAVDDHSNGITHTIRAKEHADNEKKEMLIFDCLEWEKPQNMYVGRINFKDMRISCSKTKALISEGVYTGWDDIRLPFFEALKRRGYQPNAFIKYALDVGVSLNDKTVSSLDFFKTINAFNKDCIDANAHRYFFIDEPKLIIIKGSPKKEVKLSLHPEHPKSGKRKFEVHDEFYITSEDYDSIKADTLYRLMDCINFEKRSNTFIFHDSDVEEYRKKGDKIFHWLPKIKELIKVDVLMPDGTKRIGFGEPSLKKLHVGKICQFERFGFVRLDEVKKDKMIFWFSHK